MTSFRQVLIVDDEELARLRIRRYFEAKRPDLEIREAKDGVDGLQAIRERAPDLLFLDIEMPGLSGFDLLRQLESRPFAVIFQTAFDQFAIRAFDENAVDYLLKPFTDQRLEQALAKAKVDPLPKISPALIEAGRYLERFVVTAGARTRVIDADEVLYFLSERHVTRIMMDGIDFAYDQSLTHLEQHLDPRRFVRIHRNSIVALRAVAHVERGTNAKVKLKSGQVLAVSRERKGPLLEALTATGHAQ